MSEPMSDPNTADRPVPNHPSAPAPSPWVVRWLSSGPPGGRLLDVACGGGRHAQWARAAGFSVLAVDRDPLALDSMQRTGVEARQEDLEHGRWSFGHERFDAIVCTNYLFRPRLDLLAGLLAPGGIWVYETFAVGNERYGRPSNPDFLLRPGELAAVAARAGLHLLGYEDGFCASPKPARVQRMAAVRPPFDPQTRPLG
jgi:SAM-dependent methyltransferase